MSTRERGRPLTHALLLTAAALLAAAPAWAEADAQARLGRRLNALGTPEPTPPIAATFDLDGLTLHRISRRVGDYELHAERVRILPGGGALRIEVTGFRAAAAAPSPAAPPPAPRPAELEAAAAGGEPDQEHLRALLRRLHDVRTEIDIDGTSELPIVDDLVARVSELRIVLPGDGEINTSLDLELNRGATRLWVAHAELATHEEDLRHATFRASGRQPQLGDWKIAGELAPEYLALALTAEDERSATLRVDGDERGGITDPIHADLELRRIPLAAVHSLAGTPLTSRLPELGLDGAEIDGRVALSREGERRLLALDDTRIRGLRIASPRLSRDAFALDELGIDGQASWQGSQRGLHVVVSHGDAQVALDGASDGERIDLDATLAPITCQSLLEAAPAGLLPALDGMQLAGDIDGSLQLSFALDEVTRHGERERESDTELPPPGVLALDFPYLDRCSTRRDAPGIDLEALRGPYRHAFVRADGGREERVLTAGAPGFVDLDSIPNLAMAFVILEDARYWHHDGFDREQMERAFWHNLGAAGFDRGASTISQQTARNLWLGGDRSMGRKLQEAVLASRLEGELDKRRILELYLNVIELGPGVHGVADAADYHFGKRAQELTLLEALYLASLAPAPVTYSRRWASGQVDDAWLAHLHGQVRRLRQHGWIDDEPARAALREHLSLRRHDGDNPA